MVATNINMKNFVIERWLRKARSNVQTGETVKVLDQNFSMERCF